jgi:hypothetical protein
MTDPRCADCLKENRPLPLFYPGDLEAIIGVDIPQKRGRS